MITYRDVVVFGVRMDSMPPVKIVNLPSDTKRVKLRMRKDQFTIAYVKTSNAVTAYHLRETDGGDWGLFEYPIGINITTKL